MLFVLWLAANHPEFGITNETEWTGTRVRPSFLTIMFYLFFSEDWEMGVSWHATTAECDDWAKIYLRHRFSEVGPSYAFKISSWNEEEYELHAIDPESAFSEPEWLKRSR